MFSVITCELGNKKSRQKSQFCFSSLWEIVGSTPPYGMPDKNLVNCVCFHTHTPAPDSSEHQLCNVGTSIDASTGQVVNLWSIATRLLKSRQKVGFGLVCYAQLSIITVVQYQYWTGERVGYHDCSPSSPI